MTDFGLWSSFASHAATTTISAARIIFVFMYAKLHFEQQPFITKITD